MATKEQKGVLVAELEELFSKSTIAIVADLSGYTVAEITKFRRTLDNDQAQCKIAKNTLIKIASAKSSFAPLGTLAKGPTALIFGYGEAPIATKSALTYIKTLKKGEIKGGVMEGKLLSGDQLKALSELPSREVLLGGIAGALDSGASGIAGALAAVIRDIAVLVEKVAEKNSAA